MDSDCVILHGRVSAPALLPSSISRGLERVCTAGVNIIHSFIRSFIHLHVIKQWNQPKSELCCHPKISGLNTHVENKHLEFHETCDA